MNLQGIHKSKRPMSTSMRSSSLSPSLLIQDALKELLNCKPATFMVDAEGLTPLLLAAQQGSLMALWLILKCSPQSAELCDNRGRTMLHCLNSGCLMIDLSPEDYASGEHEIGLGFSSTRYWELKKLLNIPEIDAIKDSKDYNGSTPAHVALGNGDFVLVKVLFECFADFTIKNKHGVSALDLIKTCPNFATKMEEVNLTEKVLGKQLDEMIIQKAKKGDVTLFESDIEKGELVYHHLHDQFMRRTSQGHSILHEAVRHGHQTFVEEAIKRFPTLVFTADSSGETPLHVGAKLKNHHPVVETLLQLTQEWVNKFRAENGHLFLGALPWRQRNSEGDTPLHEALHSSNYEMAKKLVQIDSELCSLENNAGETPLHILARCSTYSKFDTIGAMVKLLMNQNENVVYKRDSHGFTPLLRASYCGRIRVAYWIIRNCPASVQFRDPKGRNFLHLLRLEPVAELEAMTVEDMLYVYSNILVLTSKAEVDGCQGPFLTPLHKYKDLRKLTGGEFDALRSSQDHDGNTPLHSALNDKNFGAAKFLLHWCVRSEVMQEMSIYNNKSQSVLNILELLDDDASYVKELKDLASLAQKKIKEEAFGKQTMDKEVYKEAVNGNMDYFLKENEENQDTMKFLSQVAPDGSNILHIALQHRKVGFAKQVMECYPDLMWERDYNGNTPLHTAAKLWDAYNLFNSNFEAQWEKACRNYHDSPTEEGLLIIPPWRVKNSQGNTPCHEAANNWQYPVPGFRTLHTFDPEATTYVNRTGDTSLHIYAQDGIWIDSNFVIDVRDREGLTPLLRAAKCGNSHMVHNMLKNFPQLIQVQDDRGRSLLHHLRVIEEEWSQKSAKELYNKFPTMDGLRKTKDFDGNTPLHWTIQDGNPMAAKLIAERFVEADDQMMAGQQLLTKNNEGKSIMDLLASHDDAPTEVLQLLINKAFLGANVHGLYAGGGWVRSGYGVCKSQIKDMANTLSVVAGLLATITFATTFQVPGGFSGQWLPSSCAKSGI